MTTQLGKKLYYSRVPRNLKPGEVLVHNHIRHTKDMPSGVNGFRFWTQKLTPDVVPCKCGWKAMPHYRGKRTSANYQCEPGSWQKLEAAVERELARQFENEEAQQRKARAGAH